MEKIILGLLMLRSMSIYDIKVTVDKKLNTMCSSSSGSIHTAISKLLKKGYISCMPDERRNVYYITAEGRKSFTEWLSTPINPDKAKNIEVSKVFFMGLTDPALVPGLINEYIDSQKKELDFMEELLSISQINKEHLLTQSKAIIIEDPGNAEGVKKLTGRDMTTLVEDIYTYQMEILRYSIDSLHFEIAWYEGFLARRCSR